MPIMNLVYRLVRLMQYLASMIYESWRGPRQLQEITSARASIEAMTATSIDGVTTTIHCQERRYRCLYKRWYIRDHTVSTYFVFATVQGAASPTHVEACSMERSFPKLLHTWMPSASQKEAAIEAYLDLLLERLQRGHESFPNTMPAAL